MKLFKSTVPIAIAGVGVTIAQTLWGIRQPLWDITNTKTRLASIAAIFTLRGFWEVATTTPPTDLKTGMYQILGGITSGPTLLWKDGITFLGGLYGSAVKESYMAPVRGTFEAISETLGQGASFIATKVDGLGGPNGTIQSTLQFFKPMGAEYDQHDIASIAWKNYVKPIGSATIRYADELVIDARFYVALAAIGSAAYYLKTRTNQVKAKQTSMPQLDISKLAPADLALLVEQIKKAEQTMKAKMNDVAPQILKTESAAPAA